MTATRGMLRGGLLVPCCLMLFGCPPGAPPPAAPTAPDAGAVAVPAAPTAPDAGAVAVPAAQPPAAPAQPAADPAREAREKLLGQAKTSIDWGLHWLREQQAEDGSYGNHPGITAMVLLAFLQSHRKYREEDGPFVSRGVEYLTKLAKPNGAIFDKNLPTYNTALAILALQATDNPAHRAPIEKAQKFLVGLQVGEAGHRTTKDKDYGGIGYGDRQERPDLPNLQFALEALAKSGYSGDRAVFERALRFVDRCQNRSESNDQPWAGNDGGFIYTAAEAKAGKTQSYGSMTYAGLLSLMYADVVKSDPRVVAAYGWAQGHWDLDTHPGMGDTGLYFYYQTLAKALAAYGQPTLVDSQGRSHDWAMELMAKLLEKQSPDGFWVNSNPEYWEGNKLLCTARALLAFELAYATAKAAAAPPATAPAAPPTATTAPAAPPAPTTAPAPAPAAPPAPAPPAAK